MFVSLVFRRFVRQGSSLLAGDRQCHLIPKGPPFSSVTNYRPIYITSILSKVFECLVSVRLGRYMERSGVLPTTQFAYLKGLGICDAVLCVSHTLQGALESGKEAIVVQIDFSAVFDRANHQGILYKLNSVGIGSSVWSMHVDTVSIKSITACTLRHYDTCRSTLVNVISGELQEVFWAHYYSPCTPPGFFHFGE